MKRRSFQMQHTYKGRDPLPTCALIGVDGFQVDHVPHHVVLIYDTIASQHVSRLPGNVWNEHNDHSNGEGPDTNRKRNNTKQDNEMKNGRRKSRIQ